MFNELHTVNRYFSKTIACPVRLLYEKNNNHSNSLTVHDDHSNSLTSQSDKHSNSLTVHDDDDDHLRLYFLGCCVRFFYQLSEEIALKIVCANIVNITLCYFVL